MVGARDGWKGAGVKALRFLCPDFMPGTAGFRWICGLNMKAVGFCSTLVQLTRNPVAA